MGPLRTRWLHEARVRPAVDTRAGLTGRCACAADLQVHGGRGGETRVLAIFYPSLHHPVRELGVSSRSFLAEIRLTALPSSRRTNIVWRAGLQALSHHNLHTTSLNDLRPPPGEIRGGRGGLDFSVAGHTRVPNQAGTWTGGWRRTIASYCVALCAGQILLMHTRSRATHWQYLPISWRDLDEGSRVVSHLSDTWFCGF